MDGSTPFPWHLQARCRCVSPLFLGKPNLREGWVLRGCDGWVSVWKRPLGARNAPQFPQTKEHGRPTFDSHEVSKDATPERWERDRR